MAASPVRSRNASTAIHGSSEAASRAGAVSRTCSPGLSAVNVRIASSSTLSGKTSVAPGSSALRSSSSENSPCFAFSSRRVTSEILIKDGDTVAVAGLFSGDHEEAEDRPPILGRIPLIGGYLFGYTRIEAVEKETIIMITPKLVTPTDGENIRFDRAVITEEHSSLGSR